MTPEQKRIRELELELELAEAEEADPAPAQPVRHGATGGWGLPDPGPLKAIGTKFLQGATKGGADEGIAAAFALGDRHGPGAFLRLPDGTMAPVPTREDMYRGGRDFLRQEQQAADQHWPKLGFGAQMGGEILSDVALAGAGAASRGYQTLAGLARGLMSSDADLTPGRITPRSAGSATLSSLLHGVVGNVAPLAVSKASESGVGKYLAGKLDDAATGAGNKLQDLAGWLKVNSLHPTPSNAEAMASLPGGTAGVGRELLERGTGGFTKASTARQVAREVSRAGAAIDDVAKAYDSRGGAPLLLDEALDAASEQAARMYGRPTTRAAGERLGKLIEDYRSLYSGRPVPATEALALKREIAKEVYGAKDALSRAGDKAAGEYAEGLARFERAIDEGMDKALGPAFGDANVAFQRLLGASNAAERDAARQQTNLLALGLQNLGGGSVGAMVGGGPGAAAGLLGTLLLRKYGSQAGARTAFGAGRLVQSLPGFARYLSEGVAPQSATSQAVKTLRDLIPSRPERPTFPVFAMEDGQ